MLIYPALDLLDGKCVRLQKGDFNQQTIYSDQPEAMVRTFIEAGAKALHLVDLSGAKDPNKRQFSIIQQLASSSKLKIQCGGGVRSIEDVRNLLECGIERVVLGSIAVSNPTLVKEMFKEFGPKRITLAIDVVPSNETYLIAIEGWKKTTTTTAFELIATYLDSKVERILCTDISRDGMMEGPNLSLYQELMQKFPGIDFQASGGMSKAQDIDDLEKIGVKSLVIGKAMYEGSIDLKDVLQTRGAHAH